MLDALTKAGVQHAVVSPGSRSTPLTIAAADHPDLTTSIILDERSAGFFALGVGKKTGIPAVLICTSGTAVANYLPAVVEARNSGVPMVILSADRPPGLRGIGASQTIDQIKLFGDYAVWFHEAGEPAWDASCESSPRVDGTDSELHPASTTHPASTVHPPGIIHPAGTLHPAGTMHPTGTLHPERTTNPTFFEQSSATQNPKGEVNDLRRLRLAGSQAVHAAILKGGASHINLPFRKPLEPTLAERKALRQAHANESQTPPLFFPAKSLEPTSMNLPADVIALLTRSKRPLCIAGPAHPHTSFPEAVSIAEWLQAPLLAEPGSQLQPSPTTIFHAGTVLASGRNANPINPNETLNGSQDPDLILLFGHQPVTKSVLSALRAWEHVPLIHIVREGSGLDLPLGTVASVRIPANTVLDTDFSRGDGGASALYDPAWLARWKAEDGRAASRIDSILESYSSLTDPHVFRTIPRRLNGFGVMVSNSFPVRDFGMFRGASRGASGGGDASGDGSVGSSGGAGGNGESLVFVNRGAAGIDGILSTAAGLAKASSQKWACFIGDLAFLHDSNALMTLRNLKLPMIVFVINNGGGTIFRMLPVADQTDLYQTYFETPQQVSIGQLAGAHGLGFQRIETREQLEAWRPPESLDVPLVVECVTSADDSMKIRKAADRVYLGDAGSHASVRSATAPKADPK